MTRCIPLAIYVVLACIIGSLVWSYLFGCSGGRGGGFGFANLYVSFSTQKRQVLADRVEWLIVTPEFPVDQEFANGQWLFRYHNGKEFTFAPNPTKPIWVDPVTGPTTTDVDISLDLLKKIESSRDQMSDMNFMRPEELLSALEKSKASQVCRGGKVRTSGLH